MNFKLKNRNGKVTFLLKTGNDFSKNEMSISAAQHIIDSGNLVDSGREGYPICIDEKWYFESEPVKIEAPTKKNKVKKEV